MTDKYHPIPGVQDTIDCLRMERDELKEKIFALEKEKASYREALETIANAGVTVHTNQVPYPLRPTVENIKQIAEEALVKFSRYVKELNDR